MKECTKCKTIKDIEDFSKGRNQCKICIKKIKIEYYQINKERELLRCATYRENNRQKIKENDYLYYKENKEKVKKRVKEYRENNKEEISKKRKAYYYHNNINEKIKSLPIEKQIEKKEKRKIYSKNNKEKLNSYQRKYFKERRKNDNLFKLSNNIRGLFRLTLKNKGLKKNSKTSQILGCSFEEFKLHLESKFQDWMTWENYGKYNGELNYGWDIDHINPVSNAKTEEEIYNLNHYLNLQPLCSKINRHVKRNKLNINE